MIDVVFWLAYEGVRLIREAPARRTMRDLGCEYFGEQQANYVLVSDDLAFSFVLDGPRLVVSVPVMSLGRRTKLRRAKFGETTEIPISTDRFNDAFVVDDDDPHAAGRWNEAVRASFMALAERGDVVTVFERTLTIRTLHCSEERTRQLMALLRDVVERLSQRAQLGPKSTIEVLFDEADPVAGERALQALPSVVTDADLRREVLDRASTEVSAVRFFDIALALEDRDAIEIAVSRGAIDRDSRRRHRADELLRELSGRRRY